MIERTDLQAVLDALPREDGVDLAAHLHEHPTPLAGVVHVFWRLAATIPCTTWHHGGGTSTHLVLYDVHLAQAEPMTTEGWAEVGAALIAAVQQARRQNHRALASRWN